MVDRPVSRAAPQRMSRSDDLDLVEAECGQRASQHHHAGDDRRRPVGVEPGHLAALLERDRGELARAWRAGARQDSRWPSTSRPSAPRSMPADWVAVPATATAAVTRSRSRAGTAVGERAARPRRRAPRAPRAPAGRSAGGARSGGRRRPGSRRGRRPRPRSPITSSVEPPPMSITSSRSPAGACARGRSRRGRSGAPPRRRRACGRRSPKRSRTASANSAPLDASRTAEVITAVVRSAPCSAIASAYCVEHVEHALPRRLAERAGRVDALAEPGDDRAPLDLGQRVGARRRRSAAASSSSRCRRPRRGSVGLVRHRLAGERGEQVVDGDLGHLVARPHGRRADVGDDEQVRRAAAAGGRRAAARGR